VAAVRHMSRTTNFRNPDIKLQWRRKTRPRDVTVTYYLKISWDLKELYIPANFVLFYLNGRLNLLRMRWHLMSKFQSMEQSIKLFGNWR
jgi:hypothetical protein